MRYGESMRQAVFHPFSLATNVCECGKMRVLNPTISCAAGAVTAVDRKLAAILSADVAGFSRLAALDEESTVRALDLCRGRIAELVSEHGGRIFGSAGDGLVAEFPSAVQAVRCAVEIQRRLLTLSEGLPPDRRLEFRIGVNLGDVVVSGDDLLGDGVNIAARLQEIAAPSGICISASVREHLDGKVPFMLTSLGERSLKNIPRPICVFRVDWQQETPAGRVVASGRSLATGRGKDQPSVVVMPFDNLSGQGDEYFVDGVVEEITAALSRVRDFFVIARQSAFTYKGRFVDVREVGRKLGVNYVVEGTVRRGGNRLRISCNWSMPRRGLSFGPSVMRARPRTSSSSRTELQRRSRAQSIQPSAAPKPSCRSVGRQAVFGPMTSSCAPTLTSGATTRLLDSPRGKPQRAQKLAHRSSTTFIWP